jgi:Family of unknown function (DUF5335)
MLTYEVPQPRWADFLFALALQHREEQVRVEVDGESLGEQPLGEHLALVDISLEEKGSARGSIALTLASEDTELSHRIAAPTRLYVEETDSGELVCLDIEDGERRKTLVAFEPSTHSQTL